jgi:hypothetical protein
MTCSPSMVIAVAILAVIRLCSPATFGQAPGEIDTAKAAAAYRQGRPVLATSDGNIVCEAEEFRVEKPGGWQPQNWGSNYYAATFSNTFLSRKACLGAPEQCERSTATIEVDIPTAGRYLALVRYEAAYRFETQFRLKIEQAGATRLDRLYGARQNLKIWAFGQRLKTEVAWSWGAVENTVWEGHDAYVDLQAGPAQLTLIADRQTGNAARRNVDLVLLTRNEAEVKERLEKENQLPLDGLLTQADDVFLKLDNQTDGSAMTLNVAPCVEHSPYWVHLRKWKAKAVAAESGKSTDWVEVGSLLDTLNDGQWKLTAAPGQANAPLHYKLEFGVRNTDGAIASVATFESRSPVVSLAYDANTRYTRRIRRTDTVLYDLLDYLKQGPVRGKLPGRTLIFASTFEKRPDDPRYNAAVDEFKKMFAITSHDLKEAAGRPVPTGYVDVRDNPFDERRYKQWQAEGVGDKIAVVSLGDEIGMAAPPANDNASFHKWLRERGLTPGDVDPAAGTTWEKIVYSPSSDLVKSNPRLFYYSRLYEHHFAIQSQKKATDFVQRFLPNAGIGANYSPHGGYPYLGETHMWVTLFREGGMTLPWSEDYAWQVPVGSQQMNSICLDLFRAGLKGRPRAKILYYVMAHWGNTPASWRRQFYGDLAHGMKIVNLFEFRPVQAAYTENHVDQPEMYREVRRAFHELGTFEDIVQDGQVRPGVAAMWFSETGDIWDDGHAPFGAAKRCLYIAIKDQQVPLDFVIEPDALDGSLKNYKVLYLADQHVSRAASKAIADWVRQGGRLLATAGAGMLDEFNGPNTVLRDLLGVEQTSLDAAEGAGLLFEKQDLPFSREIDQVAGPFGPPGQTSPIPVIGARSRIKLAGAESKATFADGSPALTVRRQPGALGAAWYAAFLPGLSYFKPAIPMRPVDRGATDDAMAHLIPTAFDPGAAGVVALPLAGLEYPVTCSNPLVETSIIESEHGTLIPLINWSGAPIRGLKVALHIDVAAKEFSLAGGAAVKVSTEGGTRAFTLDLDVADGLLLR